MPTLRLPIVIICLGICLGAILPGLARAASVTLTPTQDAFVSSANPTDNYGLAGALLVNAAGLPKGEFDSLLQFNLASAASTFNTDFGAGQWTIQSITLQMTSATPNNTLFNSPAAAGAFTLTWMQNNSWVEGTGTPAAPTTTGITYDTLPSFRSGADESLGTYSFPGGTTGNNTYTLGLASSFLADATAGGAVSLLALPADTGIVYTTNSKDYSAGGDPSASWPMLTVTAVPEPGVASLLLGGVGLGLLRRRRQAPVA